MDRSTDNEHPTPEPAADDPGGTDGGADTGADAGTTEAADAVRPAPGPDTSGSDDTVRITPAAEDTDANDTVILASQPVSTDAFDTVRLEPLPADDPEFAALGLTTAREQTDSYDTLPLPPSQTAPENGAPPAEPEPAPADGAPKKAERDPDAQRWWAILLALPAGVFGAIVGLGPWVLTGARLPAQDLWAADTAPFMMPLAMLPLSQNNVVQIFSFLVVGAALAGILGRALRLRGVGVFLLELGVLGVQGWATVQATMVLREGLQDRFESAMYVVGLLTGTILSILVGVMVTLLIASAPRAGALIGLTIGAIGTTAWLTTLLFATGFFRGPFSELAWLLPWVAPVLTGLAIAWTGVNTVGRIISTIVALAMLWIAPAVTTAVANVLGNRVVFRSGDDLLAYGSSIFRSALLVPELALPPVIVAAVMAAVVIGIVLLVRALVKERPLTESRT
ncbi:hypothetical protein [Microbacterium thalassium]|uniref:Uncharacterized protein n=1 Tax=Microbacterium thalassium TaxID=362649 RepID=A0A7X0FT83_9MICO|nr:hypothetical protein [Microbacterium thalassium]MBB6392755.1 hypothetical protein [Microbacterium thalassium]GLK23013.1 hypothetical protein GCM10017607_03310 [Microbacterium thalassium]